MTSLNETVYPSLHFGANHSDLRQNLGMGCSRDHPCKQWECDCSSRGSLPRTALQHGPRTPHATTPMVPNSHLLHGKKSCLLTQDTPSDQCPRDNITLVARCIICSCRGRQVCSFSIINENRPLPLKDSRKRPYGFNSHPSFPGQKCLLDVSVATWQGQTVSASPHRAQRGFLRTRGVILQ